MRQYVTIATVCVGLSACSNPLERIDKLEDISLADPDVSVAALPDAEKVDAQNQSIFSRLKASLAGSKTARGVDPLAQDTPAPEAFADQDPALSKDIDAAVLAVQTEAVEATPTAVTTLAETAQDTDGAAADPEAKVVLTQAGEIDRQPKKARGVLAWLARQKSEPVASQEPELPVIALSEKDLVTETPVPAMPAPQIATVTPVSLSPNPSPKVRRGLLSLFKRDTPEMQDEAKVDPEEIGFGAALPFGDVALVCGKKTADFGQRIASYPETRPVYHLYDADPTNTAPHPLYLTGFKDGCARQITASVAVFGSVELHEQLRYVLPDGAHPFSDTDKAYEKLKRKVCGVARKTPCGEDLPKLAKDTVFVSAYDRYGDAEGWANLLLHNGQLVATDLKTN
ncbi:MAG: hypothetical protein JXR13_12935 [Thalassovita sp.]